MATGGAWIVARLGLGIHPELGHQPAANIVEVKVAANPKLSKLEFIVAKDFARSPNRIVFRVVEVIRVVDVEPDLRGEELRSVWSVFGARVTGKPCEVRKGEWFRFLIAGGWLFLCDRNGRFCGRNGSRKVIARGRWLCRCRGDLAVGGMRNGLSIEL